MITQAGLTEYRGECFIREASCLYVPPHPLLLPYITHYTISFPAPAVMPDDYTILPSASATLTMAFDGNRIAGGLRGVNTTACTVGAFANKMRLLLLIEFRPGGLYPFIPVDQRELLDASFNLEALDAGLERVLENTIEGSDSVQGLIESLDGILLRRLSRSAPDGRVASVIRSIRLRHGEVSMRALSDEAFYSPRQLLRLFSQHVGASPKAFARVVRVNHALRLLQERPGNDSEVAAQAGYYDQPHFIREFQVVCGVTPSEYRRKMSVFYNEKFKL